MTRKILVIEDDATTAQFIAKGLTEAGFLVETAADGRDGLFHATDGQFDAIILDRMLPKLDGLAVLKAVRAAGLATPVIILSALSSLDERVIGLNEGSDDYLAKPFAFSELLARLEALLRRPARGAVQTSIETHLRCADLEVDLLSRKVSRAGKPITLQPREFRLLEYLLRHKDQAVTRTMLLEGVWDYHFDPQTNVIDVHISRLRQKIDKDHATPLLHTVRGAGYMLSATP
jgi:two-component system, OmpR family, response regulator